MSAEVAGAVAGMEREEADDVAQRLVTLYEPRLKQAEIGRPFEEVYDVVSVCPTADWQGTYDEVKSELEGLGIPL